MTLIDRVKSELHHTEGQELELEARLRHLEAQAKHVDHSRPVPRHGVHIGRGADYAWHGPVDAAALHAAGVTFAARYIGPEPGVGKWLGHAEARELSAHGIELVAIFETTGNTSGGLHAGAVDAQRARDWGRGLVPAGRPVYFTNDREAIDGLVEYVRGAAGVLGHYGVGLYGGLAAIDAIVATHACHYLWQTYAWSGGQWSSHAQLRQYSNGRYVAGIECDLDEARAADFGQWRG